MSDAARTPVIVGVGQVLQRLDDPLQAAEPLELMARALERAGEDAGSRALLERADSVGVPRGILLPLLHRAHTDEHRSPGIERHLRPPDRPGCRA